MDFPKNKHKVDNIKNVLHVVIHPIIKKKVIAVFDDETFQSLSKSISFENVIEVKEIYENAYQKNNFESSIYYTSFWGVDGGEYFLVTEYKGFKNVKEVIQFLEKRYPNKEI